MSYTNLALKLEYSRKILHSEVSFKIINKMHYYFSNLIKVKIDYSS